MISVALLPGDGIGPEVTAAARRVIDASGAEIDWVVAEIGEAAVAASGNPLPEAAVHAVRAAGAALKGPVTTSRDGYRSVNLTLRERLGLSVQVRLSRSLPGVPTPYPGVDIVVVRATTEDLYSGVEFASGSAAAEGIRQAINAHGFDLPAESGITVKAVSPDGCRLVCGAALDWARAHGRQRVTVVHKATNIRCTDGLFLQIAREVAESYPDLEVDDCLVDAMAARLVQCPQDVDLLLTQSVFGDVLSDLTAALVGGVGVSPAASLGRGVAVFEPVHGSAPKHTGRDDVDPLGMILSGVLLLRHVEQDAAADRIEGAVAAVLGNRLLTYDLARIVGVCPVSTSRFTEAVVEVLAESVAPRCPLGSS